MGGWGLFGPFQRYRFRWVLCPYTSEGTEGKRSRT